MRMIGLTLGMGAVALMEKKKESNTLAGLSTQNVLSPVTL